MFNSEHPCKHLVSDEQENAGRHKPQHSPLQCHIIFFLSSGSHEPQPFGLRMEDHTTFESSVIKSMLWYIIFIVHNVLKNKPFKRKYWIYFLEKTSLAVYVKRNHHYFNLKLKYKVFYISLLLVVAGFLKIKISMPKIYYLQT